VLVLLAGLFTVGIVLLGRLLNRMEKNIMSRLQEALDIIAAEKVQVAQFVTDVTKQLQDLKDQIAAGNPITNDDLDTIIAAVKDIYTPPQA
jgi:phosphate uptake regulator